MIFWERVQHALERPLRRASGLAKGSAGHCREGEDAQRLPLMHSVSAGENY
jgi:hypothetical protein